MNPEHSAVSKEPQRRFPIGAEASNNGTHFRVWAPSSNQVHVRLHQGEEEAKRLPLEKEEAGYFSGFIAEAVPGMSYQYELDHGTFADPVSRFQPRGPHEASLLVDPDDFEWTDEAWKGVTPEDRIIYELHIGTFTPEGTWAAATTKLEHLAELGITLIEVMPVAEFPGKYGWGYDGVNIYAPTRLYGQPNDFRTFVNRAHELGMGVILDVVYNHLGPDGNYLSKFSPDYFSSTKECEWGDALNFDGPNSRPVREFFISNAAFWIEEYHLDGLRLDATQQIFDDSSTHVLAELVARAKEAGIGRQIFIVGENEPQEAHLIKPPKRGGFGMDALWNDDFHHSAIIALTGRREAYYTDYKGTPQEFISSAKWGFIYQGQHYRWQKKRRGTPTLDLDPRNFVTFIQNHDQIANSLWGRRIHNLTSSGKLRAMTALLLLGPGTPMLFQGQEFAASTPFLYFADHHPELAAAVEAARAEFLSQFPGIASPETASFLSSPHDDQTFQRCKLDFADREKNAEVYKLHCDLIQLRKRDPFFSKVNRGNYDGAVLGPATFILRYFGQQQDDRLLIINFDDVLHFDPAPEPLLAPVAHNEWQVLWSSEDPCYGGDGTPTIENEDGWYIPAQSAIVLIPKSKEHDTNTHPKN